MRSTPRRRMYLAFGVSVFNICDVLVVHIVLVFVVLLLTSGIPFLSKVCKGSRIGGIRSFLLVATNRSRMISFFDC